MTMAMMTVTTITTITTMTTMTTMTVSENSRPVLFFGVVIVIVVVVVSVDVTISCLLLVTITVVLTMVIIVVFYTKTDNYDQLLVNRPPTSQQTRNCHVVFVDSVVIVMVCCSLAFLLMSWHGR